ncbi:MAG: signal peptidase II [Hyphomicrobiaceae bacterium]|nr:signal peptidase II [Hyphomicrobiaceae bacterium]
MIKAVNSSLLWGPMSRLGLWVVVATFALDQAHKWWMIHVYRIGERGRVHLAPFLDLVFVLNKGVSYGLLHNTGPWLLTGFAVVTSLLLWGWLSHATSNRVIAWSLGLIIGGALANALDRVLLGGVADFFSLHAFGFYWYVFNIADVAIVAGVVGLLYDSFWTSRKDASKAA